MTKVHMTKAHKTKATSFAIAAGAVAALALAGLAVAQNETPAPDPDRPWTQPDRPESERLSLGEIEARLEAEGLEIHELDREGSNVEVKARDERGRWYEIDVDAYTGEILRTEEDDD